jgi:hypothetical protein
VPLSELFLWIITLWKTKKEKKNSLHVDFCQGESFMIACDQLMYPRCVHGVESLAILDAMKEEFHQDKMIAPQKTKGMRELLNLKSSINYGDVSAPSRCWKGKAHMT